MLRVTRDFRYTDGSIVKRDTLLNKLREQIEVGTHRVLIVTATADGKRFTFTVADVNNGLLEEDRR